jgi:hypothetical protein
VRRDLGIRRGFVGVAPLIAVEGMVADQHRPECRAGPSPWRGRSFGSFTAPTVPARAATPLNAALASEINARDGGSDRPRREAVRR